MLINSPLQLISELKDDLYKDYFSGNKTRLPRYVWSIALPKSGSTIIENIFQSLPYVQSNKSILRNFKILTKNSDDYDIGATTFLNFPKNKHTFIKTHTSFSEEYFLIKKHLNQRLFF